MGEAFRRIGVLGAGAVGSLVGGLLAHAGYNVTLVARPKQAAAIQREGLTIRGLDVPLVVHPFATTDLACLRDVDVVLLAVKSQDTRKAIADSSPHLREDVPVVSLQNGVRNPQIIGEIIGERGVIPGVVLLGVEYLQVGEVNLLMKGFLLLGELDGALTPRLQALTRVLDCALPTQMTTAITSELWSKLLINLDLPIFALTGMDYPQGLMDPVLHRITWQAMEEGLAVLSQAAINLRPGPVYDGMEKKLQRLRLTHDRLEAELRGSQSAGFKSSALQSVLRGSTSEIDYVNGEIVRLARNADIAAPWNSALVQLSHVARSTKPVKFLSSEELEREIDTGGVRRGEKEAKQR